MITKVTLFGSMESLKRSVWFTADTHYGSERARKTSLRPYSSVMQMDSEMVKYHNSMIGKGDTLIIAGDFTDGDPSVWKTRLAALNFGSAYLLMGNKERCAGLEQYAKDPENQWPENVYLCNQRTLPIFVVEDPESEELGTLICKVVHEPSNMIPLQRDDCFWLYAHVHGQKYKRNALNVGVDCHYMRPISLGTVLYYQAEMTKYYDENVFMP